MSASSPPTSGSSARGQLAGQPDRLRGEVDVAGVALVEDEVQHAQHRADVAGRVEADAGHGALGPADPLRHRRLGDEVGRGDLPGGEPADRAQRERDGRRRRQRRVGAEEVQLQRVVDLRARAGRGLRLDQHLPRRRAAVGAGGVEELPPGHGDQPGLRVPRRVVRPRRTASTQRLLHGVLGRREVGSAADEDRDHARDEARSRASSTGIGSLRDGRRLGHRTGAARATRGSASRRPPGPPTAPRPARGRARGCRRRSPSSRR